MKKMRKIIDRSTKSRGSWREVDVGRSESCARRGEKSEEESMESGNAKVGGRVGGVLIYASSMPYIYYLTISPRGGVPYEQRTRSSVC